MTESSSSNLLPLVSSEEELWINWQDISSLVGNHSIIDSVGDLSVHSRAEARAFLSSYGFDPSNEEDKEFLAKAYQMALHYLHEELLPYRAYRSIPERFKHMSVLDLLKEDRKKPENNKPRWACVLLKLLHCAIHVLTAVRTDLLQKAFQQMQSRIHPFIQTTEDGIVWIGDDRCRIPLAHYVYKDQKTFNRVMTKLLHKPGNLAPGITDLIGVRFVTYSPYAAILLTRFLVTRYIVNGANVLPERSKNSLTVVEEVKDWFDSASPEVTVSVPEDLLEQMFTASPINPHSAESFKMIKFVQRLHIRDKDGRRFFIPFEFQILDQNSWDEATRGPGSHAAYRRRQITSVRKRILGSVSTEGDE